MNHYPYLPAERLEDRIAPAGIVAVTYSSATGAVALVGDDLGNSVNVFKTGADAYRIEGLNGTVLTGTGDPVSTLDIGKLTSLTINGNGGNDDFGLTDLIGLKTLKFDGGAGDDFVYSTNLSVKGDVTMNLGAGGGLIAFTGAATNIGGDFKAIYGDAGGAVDFFATKTSIKGAVKLVGGAGIDAFSFGGIVNVEDGLEISDVAMGMNVAFQNATVVIGKGKCSQSSIDFIGGTGDDSLKFVGGNITLKGSLEFDGGAGIDTVDLNAPSIRIDGKVSVDGGADADLIKIAGASVSLGRSVSLLGGSGDDQVTLSADRLTVDGSVKIAGGDGDDTLNILADSLKVSGSVAILGGGGSNVSSFFADGSVRGDVLLDMGGVDGGGNQTFLIGGLSGAVGALKIGGSLTVKSQATDPLNAGFSDEFWATDVTVGDDVKITMGAVDSSVFIDNIFVRGRLDLDTGAGNDLVEIEQGDLSGASIIGRIASIQLGEGDDVIRIGKSSADGSNDFVLFKGGLRVDGGAGTDASNDFLNDLSNSFEQTTRADCRGDRHGRGHHHSNGGGNSPLIKERLNFEGDFLV